MSSDTSIHPAYRPDIDGLRALAVLAVVVFHAFPARLSGGFVGVDIFFVISGFLISTIIFQGLERGGFSFAGFYARRVRRIFPALLLVLAASYAAGWCALLADEFEQLGRHIAAGAGFVSNLALWSEAGYFDNSADVKPLLHLWSLGIEEQFYLAWPLLLWLAWKRKFNLLTATAALALLSFYLNYTATDAVAMFYSPLTRFWELLCGSLLAWITLYPLRPPPQRWLAWLARIMYAAPDGREGRALDNLLSCLGLVLLVSGFVWISKALRFPGAWALLPVLGAVLVILAGPQAWVNRVILSHRLAVWFGLISFPLYLWHWPLLSFARIVAGGVPHYAVRAGAVALAVLLAWLTYRLLERPVRFGPAGRLKVAVLAGLMVLAAALGLGTAALDGLPSRMPALVQNMQQLSYKFPKSPGCRVVHPYALSSCYDSGRRHAQTVFLIGDSHMEALLYGFKQLADAGLFRYNIVAVGRGGCSPFLNVESFNGDGASNGCRDIINAALSEAMRRDDVSWVVLAGRHAARYDGTLFGEAEQEEAAKPWTYRYGNDNASNSVAFERGLNDTLDQLSLAGKKVMFVHQMPELGFDPRACVTAARKALARHGCQLARSVVEARLKPYKAAAAPVLARYPAVIAYDPLEQVCRGQVCSPFNAADQLMYHDDDHMSKIGAGVLAAQIAERMRMP